MQRLRASSYLNTVDMGDGTSLLFHGATMCIDLVPTRYVRCMIDGSDDGDFTFLSPEEKQYLQERGHLTQLTRASERAEFKTLVSSILERECENDRRSGQGERTLRFILTYNCNLACRYCYQKSLRSKAILPVMSEEFVDRLLSRNLSELFPGKAKKNLRFLLFGGEPLLPANRAAITRILQYSRKHSIKVSVATNATMVAEMADLIGPEYGKIQNVQVTLDGDQLVHDTLRVLHVGQPTFDRMVAAIRQLIRLNAHVFVRIHTHPGKLSSAKKLIEYLGRARLLGHPQVEVYFAPINSFQAEELGSEDLGLFSRLFQTVASKTGVPPSLNLDFLQDILKRESGRFASKIRFCSVGTNHHLIIDPLGDIYACVEEAGDRRRRIGTVSGGRAKFFALKKTYNKRHLLSIPECLACSVALFCGGGCANQARLRHGSIFKAYCLQNKEFIAQTLKAYYLLSENGGEKMMPKRNRNEDCAKTRGRVRQRTC